MTSMKKKAKCNNLTFGLFYYKGWRCIKNLKDIPILIRRVVFTLKHGYSPVAQFETCGWFIDTMDEILNWYRHNRQGSMIVIDDWENSDESYDKNAEAFNKTLDTMIGLLNDMNEDSYEFPWHSESEERMLEAKKEFFDLFCEYFYGFWD